MELVSVAVEMPKQIAVFMNTQDEETSLQQKALLMYPYIKNNIFSHGKIAEFLGLSKQKLISLYAGFGIPYIDMSVNELMEDAHVALGAMQILKSNKLNS